MILISSCSCRCPIHWNQGLSREWRCSWSSADRRCSNYIWVINDYIAYKSDLYLNVWRYTLINHKNWACFPSMAQQMRDGVTYAMSSLIGCSLVQPWIENRPSSHGHFSSENTTNIHVCDGSIEIMTCKILSRSLYHSFENRMKFAPNPN